MADTLCIIVPCYNEEEALPVSAGVLRRILGTLMEDGRVSRKSRILLVDDGSHDATWSIIQVLHQSDSVFQGLRFAGNAGHQNAVHAGLMDARGWADMAVTIDADLQDDPEAIRDMVARYEAGAGIVCGVRADRSQDSFLKRFTAQSYYRFLSSLGCDIVYNHADYRLMSKAAMDRLSEFDERHLFLRGMVNSLGCRVDYVSYRRTPRKQGQSKYTLRKMLLLASDGITGLSVKPLRLVGFTGIVFFALSLGLLIFSIVGACMGYPFWNWKFLSVLILFTGGAVLSGLGILGEYIGRIYDEVRRRPRYYISETLK